MMCTPWISTHHARCIFGRVEKYKARSGNLIDITDANCKRNPISPKATHQEKIRKATCQVLVSSTASSRSSSMDKNYANEAGSLPFVDKDYIVFYFKEDGRFHMMMDEDLRRVVNYKGDNLRIEDEESIIMSPESDSDQDRITRGHLFRDKEDMDIGTESEAENQSMEKENSTTRSPRQDSPQSDNGSAGSFTFPVFPQQIVGSPVAWPRPADIPSPNKHKPQRTCLRCYKF
ncbi:hypothetical protein Droror1_Dr00026966 [Drosera rotundifolia]